MEITSGIYVKSNIMSEEIKIDISSRPGYIFISLSGVWTSETAPELLKRLTVAITEVRETSILVDSRNLMYDSSVFSDYLATRDMEFVEPPGTKRIAVVEKEEIKHNVEMFELALRNLGVNARFFFDEKKALNWLTGDDLKNQRAV